MTMKDVTHCTRYSLIPDEVGRYKDRIRAHSFGANRRHSRAHTEPPCLIGGGANNGAVALPCDDHRLATETGIVALLHGGIERVHIDMNDLSRCRRLAHRLFEERC